MDLNAKLKLIFDHEGRALQTARLTHQPLLGTTNVGMPLPFLLEKGQPEFVKSPNVERIMKLHAMADPTEKEQIVKYLRLMISASLADTGYLAFLALHRLGAGIEALALSVNRYREARARRATGQASVQFSNIARVLSDVLATEWDHISQSWCEEAKATLGDVVAVDYNLVARLDGVLLRHLDMELGDANPEIFADRDKVISIWEQRFGDSEVPKLIGQIDQHFRQGTAVDAQLLATCVGRIRVLLATVSLAVARQQEGRGKPPISQDVKEATLFQHLRKIDVLGDNELKMVQALWGLASDEGAHSASSSIESARVVKNMAYEFLLLLLARST